MPAQGGELAARRRSCLNHHGAIPEVKSLHIVDVLTSPGLTGFYTDDQGAIKAGAKRDGFVYSGSPVTPGFTSIRQPGRSLSVQLVLSDGQVAYGDCATVQ